jgi:hypothetical protein
MLKGMKSASRPQRPFSCKSKIKDAMNNLIAPEVLARAAEA